MYWLRPTSSDAVVRFAFAVVQFDLEIHVLFAPQLFDFKSEIRLFGFCRLLCWSEARHCRKRNLDASWFGFTRGFVLMVLAPSSSQEAFLPRKGIFTIVLCQEGYLHLDDCSLRGWKWIWLFERTDARMTMLRKLMKERNPSFYFSNRNSWILKVFWKDF